MSQMMIAHVLVIDRKTRRRKTLSFECAGYSDAQKTIKEFRKVTKAQMRLIDLQPAKQERES